MALDYMLGYMQGRRGQFRFRQSVSDEYNAGYLKGFALYEGDIMILRQLVNRYNK